VALQARPKEIPALQAIRHQLVAHARLQAVRPHGVKDL
jgi:hypothetical protein